MSNYKVGTHQTRVCRASLANHTYHVTSTTSRRQPLFVNFDVARLASKTFDVSAHRENVHLLAWVLMPDHAHWLIRLQDGASLSRCVARLKAVSARDVKRAFPSCEQVWQPGYYDHCLRHDESIDEVANYIVSNPMRKGLVESIGDYPFWDAAWFDERSV